MANRSRKAGLVVKPVQGCAMRASSQFLLLSTNGYLQAVAEYSRYMSDSSPPRAIIPDRRERFLSRRLETGQSVPEGMSISSCARYARYSPVCCCKIINNCCRRQKPGVTGNNTPRSVSCTARLQSRIAQQQAK